MSLAFLAVPTCAQTYYKWTDERGTVHLSDQPPPGKKVEERVLEPRRALAPPADTAPRAETTPPSQGPAQVVVEKQDVVRVGGNAVRITGELKNTGGNVAENVTVVVKANDAVQGNPCLEREISPTAPTLAPGARTSFEAEITDPCLFGDAPVQVSVRWD